MKLSRRTIAFTVMAAAIILLVPLAVGWQLSRPVPSRIGLPPAELAAEAISFPSQSGSTIHGWLTTGQPRAGAILLLPSIRANRLSMVGRATFLRAAGYSTLLIDLQATGESHGEMITFGWRERLDVLSAVRFLNERLPGRPVGIIGSSLGGAAAVLATPPLRVDALVLKAVYPAIDVAVENRLRMRLGPAGAALAPLLLWQLRLRLGLAPAELRPVDHMSELRCPVLVIGGENDRHTTESDTRGMYDAAREPKQLWLIPGVPHVDFLEARGDEYRTRVLAFLASALPADARADRRD